MFVVPFCYRLSVCTERFYGFSLFSFSSLFIIIIFFCSGQIAQLETFLLKQVGVN
jgi:hypothetical protein